MCASALRRGAFLVVVHHTCQRNKFRVCAQAGDAADGHQPGRGDDVHSRAAACCSEDSAGEGTKGNPKALIVVVSTATRGFSSATSHLSCPASPFRVLRWLSPTLFVSQTTALIRFCSMYEAECSAKGLKTDKVWRDVLWRRHRALVDHAALRVIGSIPPLVLHVRSTISRSDIAYALTDGQV
eukprot:1436295-Rhodomonas_salina.1